MEFELSDVPDLTGKTVVVSGGNAGLGKESVRVLASKGAFVVLACRDTEKAESVVAEMFKSGDRKLKLAVVKLDLSSLKSVKSCSAEIRSRFHKIDALLNNAAMIQTEKRKETEDRFEYIMGVNHFGTYALTIELLNAGVFAATGQPRIVITSSENHLDVSAGILKLSDIDLNEDWNALKAYSQSKLCNLLFAYKLHRVLQASPEHKRISVIATHPGLTMTPAVAKNPAVSKFAMPLEMGVLGNVVSVASPKVKSGTYVGPWRQAGLGEFRISGLPKVIPSSKQSYDESLQDQLWEISAKRTGCVLRS